MVTEEAGVDWTAWTTSQVSLPGTCIFWGCRPFLPGPDGFLSGRAWACRGWAGQEGQEGQLQLLLGEHHTRGCEPRVLHLSACAVHICMSAHVLHVSRLCMCCARLHVCCMSVHVLCTSACMLHVCVCYTSVHVVCKCVCTAHICARAVHVSACPGGQTHTRTLLLRIFPDITLLP